MGAPLAPGVALYQHCLYLSPWSPPPPVYPITHNGVEDPSLQLTAPQPMNVNNGKKVALGIC